ncbi:MAG: PDGLE domain-containing protein [Actinomycetota bacterium]|nr:PDGLE domain-containing protein [Actinomycetota bacterium]
MNDKKITTFVVVGIIAALVIAVFISPFASSFPDGLEKIAENFGFIEKAQNTVSDNVFLIPDYTFGAVDNPLWQGALAGLFGVLIILAIFGIIFLIYKAASRNKRV